MFLYISFYLSIYSIGGLILHLYSNNPRFIKSAVNGFKIIFLSLTASILSLLFSIVQNNFELKYIASYTSKSIPLIYSIASVWAGEEGSYLLFNWLISLALLININSYKKKERGIFSEGVLISALIQLFYISLSLFVVNPFKVIPVTPADGKGLDYILQNKWIFIHPLAIFLSYTAIAIPFSNSTASLMVSKKGYPGMSYSRGWILTAWLSLLIGNASGIIWSYTTKGWKGIWRWDQLEISALIPLLTLTCLIHSMIIERKKGGLRLWNHALMHISFILISLSIYISHSGDMHTMHKFYKPVTGRFVFYFTIFSALISLFLLLKKAVGAGFSLRKITRPKGCGYQFSPLTEGKVNIIDSALSRENGLLFNNFFIMTLVFTISWGVIFPLLKNLFQGKMITIGSPYYNIVTFPIVSIIILSMGVSSIMAWEKTSTGNLKKLLFLPFLSLVSGGLYLYFIGGYNIDKTFLAHTLSICVIGTLIIEIVKRVRVDSSVNTQGENGIYKKITVLYKKSRGYLGHVIHIGVAFIFIGVTGGFLTSTHDINIPKGEDAKLNGYSFKNKGLDIFPSVHGKMVLQASLDIEKDSEPLGTLSLKKEFFEKMEGPVTKKIVLPTWKEDIIVLFDDYTEKENIILTISFFPYIKYLWIGIGVILTASIMLISLDPI